MTVAEAVRQVGVTQQTFYRWRELSGGMGRSQLKRLKVPQKQRKKGRLWLNDGSCIRFSPERPNHIWFYDSVQDRPHDGRIYRSLNIIDEFTKEVQILIERWRIHYNTDHWRPRRFGAAERT